MHAGTDSGRPGGTSRRRRRALRPTPEALGRRALPAVAVMPPAGILEGAPISGPVATFGEGDVAGPVGGIAALVDWGDGVATAAEVEADGEMPGVLLVVVPPGRAHRYAEARAAYEVTVRVAGDGGTSAEGRGVIAVGATRPEGAGAVITPTAGRRFAGAVAYFSDANLLEAAGDFAAAVDWGDGTASPGRVVADGPGQFRVEADHIYRDAPEGGEATVTVTVVEDGVAGPLTMTGRAIVGQAPPTFRVEPLPGVAPAGPPFAGVAVATVRVTGGAPASAGDFLALLTPAEGGGEAGVPLPSVALRPRPGGEPGVFEVVASGQFAGPGEFAAMLGVVRVSTGESEAAEVTIRAAEPGPVPIAGRLDPSADTGRPDDAVTATPFPVFVGTAPPYTVVLLYGRRLDHKEETLLGRTVAADDGRWQLTVGPVPDGRYTIRATLAVPAAGAVPAYLYPETRPLVIDTVGLAIVKVQRLPGLGGLRVYLLPDDGGLDEATLADPANYTIRQPGRFGLPVATAERATPGRASPYVTVDLGFGRRDAFRVARARLLSVSGLRDVAGNPLGGVFPITTHAYLTRIRPFR